MTAWPHTKKAWNRLCWNLYRLGFNARSECFAHRHDSFEARCWHAADAMWAWVQRVVYCHHNARVLSDMDYRFSCVLSEATGGRMSKTNYTLEVMRQVIEQYNSEAYDEAYNEGRQEALAEMGAMDDPGAG